MKKIILLLVILMTSCVGLKTYNGVYDLSLKDVSVKGDIEGLKFSDDVIAISWSLMPKSLNFELYNKSENPIKIIWDDVIYVDHNGKSNKVFHTGVRYIDAHSSQPPTTVVPDSRITDLIMPSDNVKFSSGYNSHWREDYLLPNAYFKKEDMNSVGNGLVGKEIKVLMPIEMEGRITNYTFIFNIDNFRVSK